MTDLATIEAEASAFESAIADRVAPAAGGILSRVGSVASLGAGVASLSVPGLAEIEWLQKAWAFVTSPWTWRALGALALAAALWWSHARGFDEANHLAEVREQKDESDRKAAAAAKAAADLATVAAAVSRAHELATADKARFDAMTARINRASENDANVEIETIHSLGRKR